MRDRLAAPDGHQAPVQLNARIQRFGHPWPVVELSLPATLRIAPRMRRVSDAGPQAPLLARR